MRTVEEQAGPAPMTRRDTWRSRERPFLVDTLIAGALGVVALLSGAGYRAHPLAAGRAGAGPGRRVAGRAALLRWGHGERRVRRPRGRAGQRRRDLGARGRDLGDRARIAREMHDVVAHSLVIAQADGGRRAGRTDPAPAQAVLEQVAATGRQALSEMRSLLCVLREDWPRC